MISLGLDQALQTSGVSIMKDGELIKYDTFTIPAYKSIEQRLGELWQQLNNLHNEYEFEYVFFEDIQNQQNAQTYQKLSMVKAAVLLWCYFNNMKYSILAPSHWRSILKDKYNHPFGRARKEQKEKAQELVKIIYNIDVDSDSADAICLHKAGLIEYNNNRSAF